MIDALGFGLRNRKSQFEISFPRADSDGYTVKT
jgi:hypothetical protein